MTYAIDGRQAKGTAVVARKSVEALLAARTEFELTFIHYETSDDPIYGHGVREVIFPHLYPRFLDRRFLRQIWYFLTTKDRFDIVQWFQPRLYPFFWLAPTRFIVATLHGAGDLTPDGRFIFMRSVLNWTLKLFNKKVTVAIAGSDYAKKDIVKRYGFDAARVRVIHNGVDGSFTRRSEAEIAAVKKKYGLPERFFLGLARLIPTKNVIRSVLAYERFASSGAHLDMHYVHVGAPDVESPRFREIVEKSAVRGRIHHVPFVKQEDLPALYSAAFALVFPILNEGFGLPAIEAMACGTPTIISKTASPGIEEGEAMLVEAKDEQSIAEAMRALVERAELRASVVEKGLAKARTLTWEATGKNLIEVYKTLAW